MSTLKIIIVGVLCAVISACGAKHSSSSLGPEMIKVAPRMTVTHLYYNGLVQPLVSYHVENRVDGIIKNIYFHYGDFAQKGQLLFTISSTKSSQDYINALTHYIKNKDQYLRSRNNFDATDALYRAGIVSKETYLNDKSQLNLNRLACKDALNSLNEQRESRPNSIQNLEKIELDDLSAIQDRLFKPYEEIKVYAPVSGIILFPSKDQLGNESKMLSVGVAVKKGENMITLGESGGVSISTNLGEADIDQVAVGQTVLLTSETTPAIHLYGKITHISQQATNDVSGEGAAFPVEIDVPNILENAKSLVRIGMNLKVDIVIKSCSEIKLPLQAVYEFNGMPTVDRVDSITHKIQHVAVETGASDVTEVVITKGLHAGDWVKLHD